jgi:phosphatidylinositol glycan class O
MNLLESLTVPILLSIGLTIFTRSFFLSRKSFTTRSSCHAAPKLLKGIGLTDDEVRFLQKQGWLNDEQEADNGGGCWTSRRIDSLVIIVVDALRFDFARDHLPLSVGSRLFPSNDSKNKARGYSKLFQFVADPPTVTMQRLKALTTGGLPTFADITGSFGGANIEEDSWVEQLIATRDHRSGHHMSGNVSRIAFVGDDTWVDLFPTQFDDSHPYPSFNTRDLDTVDNGCLMHLPRLLDGLIGLNKNETQSVHSSSEFELIVAHFLGVDHVGKLKH